MYLYLYFASRQIEDQRSEVTFRVTQLVSGKTTKILPAWPQLKELLEWLRILGVYMGVGCGEK